MEKNKQLLKEIIWPYYPLSSKSFDFIVNAVNIKIIPKGTSFIQVKNRDKNEYFLLKGICRSFLINPEGEDITISFYKEKKILSPYVTRTSNGISLLNYEAMTDLELAFIDAEHFLNLMIENIDIREMGNNVLRKELLQKVKKEIGLASLTAKERLLRFREDFPQLENLIPHPVIASYLGITNISLSRIRGELSQKK
jgi:CRP-like cAMP-binding protein